MEAKEIDMKTDYYVEKLMKRQYQGIAYSDPTTGYFGLISDVALTELTGNGYARKAFTLNATNMPFASRQVKNSAAIEFDPATGGAWSEAIAIGRWDASTAGNLLEWEYLKDDQVSGIATAADDLFTSFAHGYANTDRVVLRAPKGGTLPTGVSADTIYFVRDVTTDTFKLALTSGGAAINLTADGMFLAIHLAAQTCLENNALRAPADALVFQE